VRPIRQRPGGLLDQDFGTRAADQLTSKAGSMLAIILAIAICIAWCIGLLFVNDGLGNTVYQTYISSISSIITLIMVFILQNTQNRDNRAIHAKLDFLMKQQRTGDPSRLFGVERLKESDIARIQDEMRRNETEH
jgi:low affinity Fe/Cu permease